MDSDAANDDDHHSPGSRNETRQGRRKLACIVCRRMKTRCDFTPNAGACRRCVNLRIECSLATEQSRTAQYLPPLDGTIPHDGDLSLLSLRDSIDQLKSEIRDQFAALRLSDFQSPGSRIQHEAGNDDAADAVDPETGKENEKAPVALVRQINATLMGFPSRKFFDLSQDVVLLGLLTEEQAQLLSSTFCKHYQYLIQVYGPSSHVEAEHIRSKSPFLYATICLHGILFCPELGLLSSDTHRSLYHHVNGVWGQVVLLSPLPLDILYAMMLLSSLVIPPAGIDYIDSWLSSGTCAQQAILATDFAKIMARVRIGEDDLKDMRYLRLWNSICLTHLHLIVGTGRPSVIAPSYLDQCAAVLSSQHANTDDRLVVSEISLYRALDDALQQRTSLSPDGHCAKLETWRNKWEYLFDLQTRKMPRLCYHFAYLVLTRRTIERQATSETPVTTPSSHDSSREDRLIQLACSHALQAVKCALRMHPLYVAGFQMFEYMNLAYAALTLSEYINHASADAQVILDHLRRVHQLFDPPTQRVHSALWYAFHKAKHNHLNRSSTGATEEPMVATMEVDNDVVRSGNEGWFSMDDLSGPFPSLGNLFTETNPFQVDA